MRLDASSPRRSCVAGLAACAAIARLPWPDRARSWRLPTARRAAVPAADIASRLSSRRWLPAPCAPAAARARHIAERVCRRPPPPSTGRRCSSSSRRRAPASVKPFAEHELLDPQHELDIGAPIDRPAAGSRRLPRPGNRPPTSAARRAAAAPSRRRRGLEQLAFGRLAITSATRSHWSISRRSQRFSLGRPGRASACGP